jgi:molecular chaperone DnaK
MKLGEALYQQQAAGAPGDEAGTKNDDVVDADFEEVDDSKKRA